MSCEKCMFTEDCEVLKRVTFYNSTVSAFTLVIQQLFCQGGHARAHVLINISCA